MFWFVSTKQYFSVLLEELNNHYYKRLILRIAIKKYYLIVTNKDICLYQIKTYICIKQNDYYAFGQSVIGNNSISK